MKKSVLLQITALLAVASFALAASHSTPEATPELRPLQKIMQARAAWMKSMNENLSANKLADVSKDAAALSAQAKQVGESATNPLAKELHLAVSSLAKALQYSAHQIAPDDYRDLLDRLDAAFAAARDEVEAAMTASVV